MSHLAAKVAGIAPCGGLLELAMDATEMRQLLSSVGRLTAKQKAELIEALNVQGDNAQVRALVESRISEQVACPHCGGVRTVRNGSASGLQRYKCRAYQRTFNSLRTTPMARLRLKGKWLAHQEVLQQGLSVHEAAASLDVSPSTAFRWRHRFLRLAPRVRHRITVFRHFRRAARFESMT